MSSRPSESILEQAVLKGLSWSLYFENRKNLLIYRCIKNSCFSLKKNFSNQTKVKNESISKMY